MRFFTVRDAREARWSTVICVFLVGLVNTTVYATGFAAMFYMRTQGIDIPEAAYDYMVFILLDALAGQGWLAIAVAGSVAAGLSTVAGLLLIMGAGLIHDFYGELRPDVDDEKKLKLSYAAMFVVGVLVIIFSLNPPQFILEAIMWSFGIAGAGLGVPIVLGIWWKRTNKYGAGAGMVVGALVGFYGWIMIGYLGMDPVTIPFPIFAKYFYGPLGWIKITAIAVPLSFILTVVVSWLTPPPPKELQQQVDVMHGWQDYDEKRYNGKGLPITVIVLSLVIMWFMTTLYDVFPK
jgi:cation/acetate symporter